MKGITVRASQCKDKMAFSISPAPVRGPALQTLNEFFTNKMIPL